jgi:hypothetical protein
MHLAPAAYMWGRLIGLFLLSLEIMFLLAPHTSGPRDVPRGGFGEAAATLNVKLCDLSAWWWWWWHLTPISPNLLSTMKLKADEERAVSRVE